MTGVRAAVPLLLLLAGTAAAGTSSRPGWSRKPFGALLLVPEGGREFGKFLDDARKSLGRSFPTDTALGGDVRDIQRAVDRLQARRVRKIVAVPIQLSSHTGDMEQNRYIFGIRREPSSSLLTGRSRYGYAPLKRAKSRVPLVLMPALDDHEILAQIVAAKALGLSRDPEKEGLIIVAQPNEDDAKNPKWLSGIESLGERARAIAGFKELHTVVLPLDSGQQRRDKAHASLRDLVRRTRRGGNAIVMPLSLTRGALHARLPKILDGLFVKTVTKGLLPDTRLLPWIEESARKGAEMEDMRIYTKEVSLRAKRESLRKGPARTGGLAP